MKHLQSVKMFFLKTIFHNTTIVCFPSNAFQILLGSSQVWISFQLDVLEKKNPPKQRHEGEAPQLVPINTKEQQHYSRLPSDLQACQAF